MGTPAAAFELGLSGSSTPHRFTAFVPDGQGGKVAEHTFEWRTDSTALAMDLGSLARAAVSGQPPENNLHITFGRQLHRTVFAGEVSQFWDARLSEAHWLRQPLRLVLRVDPQTARPLLNLPWEYLHDGNDFLALNWRTPLSRLPWGLPANSLPLLGEPLRLLVVIAAPLGLSENMILNTAREEDLILSATSAARRAGKMEVEFTPNGSPEALDDALREFDPHILHFTGHGVFIQARDTGVLLMERADDGRERAVPNAEFANLLERRAKSLRLVFLSACQSAVAARNEGYADLAPRLLAAGIPAVVAMQFSVLNKSAMEFGSAFYKGLADGEAVDAALTEARGLLARESLNRVDFVVPTLFLSDPGCLQVDAAAFRVGTRTRASLDLTGVATAQNFVGRTAELRELQANLDPQGGRWRAAIVFGLGGMGKTVLAARLAERMAGRLDGVKSLRMTSTTTTRDVLDQITAFLLVNQMRFNYAGITPRIADLNRIKDQPLPLENKVALIAEILRGMRLLLIFDNCEDILSEGHIVSRANLEQSAEARSSTDPDLLKLFMLLIESVSGPTRFLFTSRADFSPLEEGRLTDAVGHVSLSEMGFRDAVYLMETLPPLDLLPVATLERSRPNTAPALQALSMRDVWEHLGGHPYTLNLFAEHSRRSTVEAVLRHLQGVRKQLLEFTLLDRAAAQLSEQAGLLLRRSAVFEEPVPVEGLSYLLGDERDAMPDVSDEVQELLSWGLLGLPPGSNEYLVHTLVRDWARGQWSADERLVLLRRAAQYWLAVSCESSSLVPNLNARHYLFSAGEYEQAGAIVLFAANYLIRWGQMELILRLVSESVRTLQGSARSVARGTLATIYQSLGDYGKARIEHEAVLAEFKAAGDKQNVAISLYQLGILHRWQGEYKQARKHYEQAQVNFQELGDSVGVANSLNELGSIYQAQGEYERSCEHYEQALGIFQELKDHSGMAQSLHNLGSLHHFQGKSVRAREYYEQALEISRELNESGAVASSLHVLGELHQEMGEYERAREYYERSLEIVQKIGNRAGAALSFHWLGTLLQDQGEYERAREYYEQALVIKQELGDHIGLASGFFRLGTLHQAQGEYEQAREYYEQALAIEQGLDDRVNMGVSLNQLGTLDHLQGEYERACENYEQALAIFQALGDSPNVASTLHNLGTLHQAQGEYRQAREHCEQSLAIARELGSPAKVMASLHLLGVLHQAQGEYKQALDYYEQALVIARELGIPANIASSLAQIGLLMEQEEKFNVAVIPLVQAFAIFKQLSAPEQQIAILGLSRLREKMGDEAFTEAWQAMGSADMPAPSGTEDKGMTVQQAIEVVVANTVAVLTDSPRQKQEWLETLGEWQIGSREQGLESLAVFLDVVRQLVDGIDPAALTLQIPAEFHEAWDSLLQAIVRKEI